MKYSVFYRTYRGDFQWLKYSLATLKKHLKDYSEIVIVMPPGDYGLLKEQMGQWDLPKGIVTYRDNTFEGDDYLGQQACKLRAYEYASFPLILFVDSDMMFKADTNLDQFMKDGKPCILKTSYADLAGTPEQGTDKLGAACVWKPITEKAAGFPVEFEYMRRLPLLYYRSTIKALTWYFIEQHGENVESYLHKLTDRSFSEFNLLGAYTEWKKSEASKYYFLDTSKEELPILNSRQYWSWGGLTPEIETEIKKILKD